MEACSYKSRNNVLSGACLAKGVESIGTWMSSLQTCSGNTVIYDLPHAQVVVVLVGIDRARRAACPAPPW